MTSLFQQSEYLHLLFNPVLTHLLPVAALGLLVSLAMRRHGAVKVALVLVFLSAILVWPTIHYGEGAYDRMVPEVDEAGGEWLDIHMYRAESWAWLFFVTALAALAALLAPLKWTRSSLPLAGLTLALGLTASGIGAYIAYPAGKVRHAELRNVTPGAEELEAARAEAHEHGEEADPDHEAGEEHDDDGDHMAE